MKHISEENGQKPKKKGGLLSALMLVLLVLSFLAAGVTGLIKTRFWNSSFYADSILQKEQYDEIYTIVTDDVKIECHRYAFSYENLADAVSWDAVRASVEVYVRAYFSALFNGETMTTELYASYDEKQLLTAIRAYAADAEDPGIYADDANCVLLAGLLKEKIVGDISILSQERLFRIENRFASYVKWMNRVAATFPVFLGAFLLVLALCYLRAGLRKSCAFFYAVNLTGLFVSEVFFIPLLLIDRYGLSQKLVLSRSVLASYISAVWDTLFRDAAVFFGICSGVFLVLVVIAAIHLRHRNEASEVPEVPEVAETQNDV